MGMGERDLPKMHKAGLAAACLSGSSNSYILLNIFHSSLKSNVTFAKYLLVSLKSCLWIA